MASYYIDPDLGSDSNDGLSSLTPKQTPPTAANGIVYNFKRSTTYSRASQWDWSTYTGITLQDYGSGTKPIISLATTLSSGINIKGAGTHTIRNIHFKDFTHSSNPEATTPNCLVFGATGTQDASDGASGEIYDCDFENIYGNAIAFNGISSSTYAAYAAPRGVVSGCTFDGIGDDAVFAKIRTYFEVSNCVMRNVSLRTTTGDGVGFLDANPAYAIVKNNYIDHTNKDTKQCIMIDGVDGTGFVIIENNTCIGYGSESVKSETHVNINVDNCKAVIRGNKVKSYGLAIAVNTGGENIYGNIIESLNYRTDETAAITFLASNVTFANNTIVCGTNQGRVIQSGTGRSGIVIKNNIAHTPYVFYKRGGGTTDSYNYNCIYSATNAYVDSVDAPLSAGANDLTSDPLLDINYRPTASSPCISAGTYIAGTRYYGGETIRGTPTIGARQYHATRTIASRGI